MVNKAVRSDGISTEGIRGRMNAGETPAIFWMASEIEGDDDEYSDKGKWEGKNKNKNMKLTVDPGHLVMNCKKKKVMQG